MWVWILGISRFYRCRRIGGFTVGCAGRFHSDPPKGEWNHKHVLKGANMRNTLGANRLNMVSRNRKVHQWNLNSNLIFKDTRSPRSRSTAHSYNFRTSHGNVHLRTCFKSFWTGRTRTKSRSKRGYQVLSTRRHHAAPVSTCRTS